MIEPWLPVELAKGIEINDHEKARGNMYPKNPFRLPIQFHSIISQHLVYTT